MLYRVIQNHDPGSVTSRKSKLSFLNSGKIPFEKIRENPRYGR
jgi:hypothetical protein